MKNKYKEQMSKISVDDEMKKRVMNKIRESQEYRQEKSFIFQGQALYKYSGIIAACCAFVVTYAVTINYPEIINNKDRLSNEIEYNDREKQSSTKEYDDITEENNDKNNVSQYNEDYEKENNPSIRNNKQVIRENNEQPIYSEENISENNDYAKLKQAMESEEHNDNSIKKINNTQMIDKVTSTDNNYINDEEQHGLQNKTDEEQVDDVEVNENIKANTAVYHEEDSEQREYLLQHKVPDLSKIGLYINYVNQISQKEVEVMYSDNERDLWIKICDVEEKSKNSNNLIKYGQYGVQEASIDNDEEKRCVVYKKNNKDYYIWSNSNIDDKLINDIIKYS